jgi:hypothetical protein
MLGLEPFTAVTFLSVALLVCSCGDVDIAVYKTATADTSTEASRSLALCIVKTGHDLNAVDM